MVSPRCNSAFDNDVPGLHIHGRTYPRRSSPLLLPIARREMHSLELVATGLAVAIALWGLVTKKASSLPTPPGPKKLPILGNLLDIPTTFEWITYARWTKEYGLYSTSRLQTSLS